VTKRELIEERADGSKVVRETVPVYVGPKTKRQRRGNAKAEQIQQAIQRECTFKSLTKSQKRRQRKRKRELYRSVKPERITDSTKDSQKELESIR
jgi:hypothetical protein